MSTTPADNNAPLDELTEERRIFEWDGPQMDGSRALRLSGARYGKYSNEDRALPDIRDGLKPVHRRMVYSMIVDGMLSTGSYNKSAAAVGTCMGDYHPHGDSSIYEALVRLAQPFSMNIPLIDGQGNFGTRGPKEFSDPPAAMRYCVTGETRVSMADGSSVRLDDLAAQMDPNSDLEIDLEVLDDQGRAVHASRLFHSGTHPTLRLTTTKGYSLQGTDNHPVLCLVGGILGWKLLADVRAGDRVVLNRSLRDLGEELTDSERQLAHLLGGLASEGWAVEHGGYKSQRAGLNDKFAFGYEHIGEARYVSNRTIKSGNRLYDFDVQNLEHLLGSMVGDSRVKRIPERVWRGTMRFKQEFLRALFTGTDSSSSLPQDTTQISYSTDSDRFATEVQTLLLEFGIVSKHCLSGIEHKIVLTNRRDARLFAERIGLLGARQAKLGNDLAGDALTSRALGHDGVSCITARVCQAVTGAYTEYSRLEESNFDRVERWETDPVAASSRIAPRAAQAVVEPLLCADYYYAEVESVVNAGAQPVFSLRVDTDEHAFLTDGFVSHNTECRLSEVTSSFRNDLHADIVPFVPNFSERKREPVVLPVTFPVLLVNGVSGIGWGMGVDIPPHNLGEVIDATVLVAEKPDATLKQVMKRLPAPDFPTDGTIVPPADGFEQIYKTGTGTFVLEGKFHAENVRGGQAMVITELPYGVSSQQIKAQVIGAARAEKITEVTELPLDKSNRQGIRIEIRLKRGGTMAKLVEQVRKYTAISTVVKNNYTVLIDGRPTQVGLLGVLTAFVEFRREIVTARLEREKAALLQSLRMLTAQRAALDVINKVIEIIRNTDGDDDKVRDQLKKIIKVIPYGTKKRVAIDDEQAQYIMDMRLKRLSALNQFELDEEIKRKTARLDEIVRILASPAEINAIVVAELREVKKALAVPRRSALSSGDRLTDGVASTSSLPTTAVTVYVSAKGSCTAVEPGKARKEAPLVVSGDDALVSVLETDTDAELHVFTERGAVYRMRAAEINIDTRRGKGKQLVSLDRGDQITAVFPAADSERPYLLMVTERGEIKRFDQSILERSHAGGMTAMSVGDDRVVAVVPHRENDEIVLHSLNGRALRISAQTVRPVKSPTAGGVAGLKLAEADRVVSAVVAEGDSLLVVHERGHAKLVALAEYPLKGRGGGGVESVKIDKPAKEPAGEVTLTLSVTAKTPIMIVTAKGALVATVPAQAPAGTRGAVASKPWLALAAGDHASLALPV